MTLGPIPSNGSLLLLLRLAASATFLGRGLIYLFWDAPYRALLWHQDLMSGPVNFLLGMEWEEYAAVSDPAIILTIRLHGAFFLLCALLCWTAGRKHSLQQALLAIGALGLAFFAFTKAMDVGFKLGMSIEHTLQWAAPLLLIWALRGERIGAAFYHTAGVAVALTFIGHGLYAAGYHPVPASFITMFMNVGTSEGVARALLGLAAGLDFAVALFLFVPVHAIRVPALWWALIWGLLTALARTWTQLSPALDYYGLSPWLFETLVRLSHALVPAAMLVLLRREREMRNVTQE